MRNTRTRLQHQAGDGTDRNLRSHPGFIDYDEGTIKHIDLSPFDKKH